MWRHSSGSRRARRACRRRAWARSRTIGASRRGGLTNLQTAALVSRTGFGSAATNRASRSDDAKLERHWSPLLVAMRGVVETLRKVEGSA